MNTLLANGEVPGLFEGDEFTTLMTQCKEGSQREGLMLDSNEELYKWFTQQVMKNLHVVFTMNPSSEGLKDRAATSPALFNRCVLNWFGDWSDEALFHVGKEFTNKLDIDKPYYLAPDYFPAAFPSLEMPPNHRTAIVNAFVYVHQTLHKANARLSKRGGHVATVTPRHFLDFINHYAELEEQQLHLNVGLQKIHETVEQVEELQKSLALKSRELEAKNQAANAKLKDMLKDQQEAEKKKMQSHEIQAALREQEEVIAVKRASVMEDLSKVEPAVLDAQAAVKSIKKQHLVEVRSMANPPAPVKLALESICLLLGEPTTDWKAIRSVIIRENFINTIVNFATDEITKIRFKMNNFEMLIKVSFSDDIRTKMKNKYVNNPEFNFEKVNRASVACGPMVKWAIAQINYADMLKRVEPLRDELQSLETAADENKRKAEEMESLINHLEKSIAAYKEEYANLVSQAQAIKADLASVQAKVDRSIALLKSLSSERKRWEATSETFKNQMATIAGDVLLSSAFLAYAGYYDQQYRNNLFNYWCTHLQQAGIMFRADLARTDFLDDSFRKNLESALRFGNPLLVQDVESYDPILNPVLNREVRKTGGRVLITLGDQDIDLSPSFCIFLSTRIQNCICIY
ncbi:cytoplasmic dynein 1 heavy chain 1 [Caerostris extrusa]|uniref:Cytoplasmic dynein 1 heavy chain 1 n=1 Tax=Caerostris extrusa TaxID=172846 RepID=A0AAV4N142_CAEEX|nr:cytoplasmic dynein 1 heavy chain 1 [Caerostris extrusa]